MSQDVHLKNPPRAASAYPIAPLYYLETLWFQVAGTLCNLQCSHCLVSASPTNKTHLMMSYDDVAPVLEEANALGVKEYYFTGGEPFMNRDMLRILEKTLQYGPANVLTNGTFLSKELAKKIRALYDQSPYSLELRISLDGTTPETNDPIRGEGTFNRILEGIKNLAEEGLSPVITVTMAAPELEKSKAGREDFYALMKSLGLPKPRMKILSLFHIGEEESRTGGYKKFESMKGLHLNQDDFLKLQCTTSRMITKEGAYVCPILVNDPAGRMGVGLHDSLKSYPLSRGACYTCYAEGVTCRT